MHRSQHHDVDLAAGRRPFAIVEDRNAQYAAGCEQDVVLLGMGRLGLDPATLALWTASWTIPSERQVACDLPIPNLPQLRGAFLAVQALLLEPGSGLRLSNAWTEAAIQ